MTASHKTHTLIWLVLVLLVVAAMVWVSTRPEPVMVTVTGVEKGLVEDTVTNTRAGTVSACRRARLAPQLSGQIAQLPVKESEVVKKDQVLVGLWNQDLQARLQLARMELKASHSRAEESCVMADVAEREAARLKTLRKKGLASEEDLDRASGDAKARHAACNASHSAIKVSEAQVEVAQANLERTLLRAPFDGTIAEVNGELGEVVTPSPIGVPTLPAIDLIDTKCYYITAPIDEVDAPAIRLEMDARITLDAFRGKTFSGRVRRIADYVLDLEKQARTVDVEVDFIDPEDAIRLLPGYSADIEVLLDTKQDVLRIPTQSIQDNDRVFVFSASAGLLEMRTIKTGLSNWHYTEVLSGLKQGEQVVTSIDRSGVEDGAAVQIESD